MMRGGLVLVLLLSLPFLSPAWAEGSYKEIIRHNPDLTPLPPADQEKKGELRLRGILQPVRQMVVLTMPNRLVERVLVAKGQKVKAGQPLVIFDSSDIDLQIISLSEKKQEIEKQLILKKELALEIATNQKILDRINGRLDDMEQVLKTNPNLPSQGVENLRERKMVLTGELAARLLRQRYLQKIMEQARVSLGRLDRQTKQLEKIEERLTVKAPFAGEVVRAADPTSPVTPDGILCEVQDNSAYLVKGQVLQSQLRHVKPGDRVRIKIEFVIEKPIPGYIVQVEPARINQENQGGYPSFPVTIRLDHNDPRLRPGMTALVTIPVKP